MTDALTGKTVGRITDRELCLIVALRTRHRFGGVTIQMKDGVVMRLEEVRTYDPIDDMLDLSKLL